jgi:CubicO group peptidase (beta-lactamase class C family)
MLASDDWVQFVLDLPMEDQPGSRFEYCNGGSFLLSAIIQETTGETALMYAEKNLFDPLGISDVDWPSNPDGISIGWGNLRMLPQDMAKIGYLYLNDGKWEDEQIVPSEWVSESTKKHIDATLQDGYGYQWWVDSPDVYMALGYAGQFIFVAPEINLVAVFTSNLPDDQFYTPQRLLDTFILPASVSSQPLPSNQEALKDMNSKIEYLQRP